MFPSVFRGPDSDDTEGLEQGNDDQLNTPDGLAKYGWFNVIEGLADMDITKFDAVLNRRCYEVFTHMTYKADYIALEKSKRKL